MALNDTERRSAAWAVLAAAVIASTVVLVRQLDLPASLWRVEQVVPQVVPQAPAVWRAQDRATITCRGGAMRQGAPDGIWAAGVCAALLQHDRIERRIEVAEARRVKRIDDDRRARGCVALQAHTAVARRRGNWERHPIIEAHVVLIQAHRAA